VSTVGHTDSVDDVCNTNSKKNVSKGEEVEGDHWSMHIFGSYHKTQNI